MAELIEMPFAGLTHVDPKNHALDGIKIGRINSQSWWVTSRRCGLLPNYFGHLLLLLLLLLEIEWRMWNCLQTAITAHQSRRQSTLSSFWLITRPSVWRHGHRWWEVDGRYLRRSASDRDTTWSWCVCSPLRPTSSLTTLHRPLTPSTSHCQSTTATDLTHWRFYFARTSADMWRYINQKKPALT